MAITRPASPDTIPPIRGRSLRFILVDHMMRAGRPVTVAELATVVTETGFTLEGRASKVISDALRWEVRRRRVVRLARGVYRYRHAPRSTARRIRVFAKRAHQWIADTLAGRLPPPTPHDPRRPQWRMVHDPGVPPWREMGWVWVL